MFAHLRRDILTGLGIHSNGNHDPNTPSDSSESSSTDEEASQDPDLKVRCFAGAMEAAKRLSEEIRARKEQASTSSHSHKSSSLASGMSQTKADFKDLDSYVDTTGTKKSAARVYRQR